MKAIWNDTIIAESDDTVVVEGNHYFRPGRPPCAERQDDGLPVEGHRQLRPQDQEDDEVTGSPDTIFTYAPRPRSGHRN